MGYSPWGHKESDTAEVTECTHARRTRALFPPELSAGPTFSFQRPLLPLPRGLPSSKPSVESLSP